MDTITYLFGGETGYFGLFGLLVTVATCLLSAQAAGLWFWERFGDRISDMFRQPRH